MGDMTIRNIPELVLERFNALADRQSISPEDLAKNLIARAILKPKNITKEDLARLEHLRSLTPGIKTSSVPIIREMRD